MSRGHLTAPPHFREKAPKGSLWHEEVSTTLREMGRFEEANMVEWYMFCTDSGGFPMNSDPTIHNSDSAPSKPSGSGRGSSKLVQSSTRTRPLEEKRSRECYSTRDSDSLMCFFQGSIRQSSHFVERCHSRVLVTCCCANDMMFIPRNLPAPF